LQSAHFTSFRLSAQNESTQRYSGENTVGKTPTKKSTAALKFLTDHAEKQNMGLISIEADKGGKNEILIGRPGDFVCANIIYARLHCIRIVHWGVCFGGQAQAEKSIGLNSSKKSAASSLVD
jgi:hypothetical protein